MKTDRDRIETKAGGVGEEEEDLVFLQDDAGRDLAASSER